MKKVILSLVFVVAMGLQMNASTDSEKKKIVKKENLEKTEEFGCASDCVRTSKRQALEFTEDWSDDELLVDNYMILYIICHEENCE